MKKKRPLWRKVRTKNPTDPDIQVLTFLQFPPIFINFIE
jgi:hypothetical protein